MYDDIRYALDGPAAIITLNRPGAMNAWTNEMDAQVRDALATGRSRPRGGRHHHHR